MEKSWKINVEKEGHSDCIEEIETEVRGGMWLTVIHLDKCACVCVWLGGRAVRVLVLQSTGCELQWRRI